jgi:hypothetical protein
MENPGRLPPTTGRRPSTSGDRNQTVKTSEVRHRMIRLTAAFALGVAIIATAAWAADPKPAPNGIELPKGYKDWRVIAVSHRSDNDTMRVIVGNDAAIAAAREGRIDPWPDGAILGKIVWANRADENWEPATVPGAFEPSSTS